jgi:hypothetical protein
MMHQYLLSPNLPQDGGALRERVERRRTVGVDRLTSKKRQKVISSLAARLRITEDDDS